MSEFDPTNHEAPPNGWQITAFESSIKSDDEVENETLKFNDETFALVWRFEGRIVNWHRSNLNPTSDKNCSIVTAEDGYRIALGAGVMCALPELNLQNGHFNFEEERRPIEIDQVAPNGLSPIIIGAPWGIIRDHGNIESVMTRNLSTIAASYDHLVDMPNHLHSAMSLLIDSAEVLKGQRSEYGPFKD